MWCSYEVEGEPKYAYRVATEHIRDVLTIFRAFCLDGLFGKKFITVELGAQQSPKSFLIECKNNIFEAAEAYYEQHKIVLIDENHYKHMTNIGLEAVDAIVRSAQRTQLEGVALDAYRLIGHAVQQRELSDKVLFLCAALESVLVNGEHDITNTLSKRLARILGHTVEERKAIQHNVKKIYGVRSKRVHEGKHSQLEDATFEFQGTVLRFMAFLAHWTSIYDTKHELIDHIEGLFMKD